MRCTFCWRDGYESVRCCETLTGRQTKYCKLHGHTPATYRFSPTDSLQTGVWKKPSCVWPRCAASKGLNAGKPRQCTGNVCDRHYHALKACIADHASDNEVLADIVRRLQSK